MTKVENGKKYSLIAALCYAVITLYVIINRIVYVNNNPDYASITAISIIYWIILIALAVTLFLKNKKAVVVAAGANALYSIYYLIRFLTIYFSVWHLFDFLSYAIVVVIIVLAFKGNDVASKIWFLAGAIQLLGNMIGWFKFEYFSHLSTTWKSILFALVETSALFFCGLWLKNDISPVNSAPVNEYAIFNPNAIGVPQAPDTIGGADKLKLYKELLDSGTITQEEFNQKKQQILGQ